MGASSLLSIDPAFALTPLSVAEADDLFASFSAAHLDCSSFSPTLNFVNSVSDNGGGVSCGATALREIVGATRETALPIGPFAMDM